MRLSPLRMVLLPCLVFLAVTLPHLGQGDFRRDSGRYAAVGHYLWAGGSLWKPYINPETVYCNKPPLALLIHGAFLKFFGISLPVARVPAILAGLGVVVLTVLTARQLGSRGEALAAGVILALTYEFFRRTREISLDMWQLFFMMAAVYLVVTGARRGLRWPLATAGVPIGLALLCKPLVALGILPVLALWLVLIRRKELVWILFVGALPLAIAVALPWHYAMWSEFGTAFLERYLGREVLARAQGRLQTNPPWYYVASLTVSYWPWAILVGCALWRRWPNRAFVCSTCTVAAEQAMSTSAVDEPATVAAWAQSQSQANSPHPAAGTVSSPAPPSQRRHTRRVACSNRANDLVLLGGSWVLLVLLLLSVFPDKKINYALPLYPMLAWIAAAGICRVPWPWLRQWYRRGLPWTARSVLGILLLFCLLPLSFQKPPAPDWQRTFEWVRQNGLGPADLGAEGFVPDDICYWYLYTGWWLPTHGERAYVLKRSKAPVRGEVFRAGDLVVKRTAEK